MAFLRNDAINRVNLHSGIQCWGLKPLLVFDTLGIAFQYPVLAEVRGVGGMLVALCIVTSVSELVYYVSYHSYFLALFVSLGESLAAYGAAMVLAGLVGAVCGLLLGRHIDAGYRRRAVIIAYGVGAGIVVLRGASLGSPWLAVAANALGGLFWPLLSPTLGVVTYNLAKASPCPLRFHMATEGAWDFGCFAACLIAATLMAAGASLALPILLALPAVAAMVLLLWRHYPRTSRPA